jgi:hypothetical protein
MTGNNMKRWQNFSPKSNQDFTHTPPPPGYQQETATWEGTSFGDKLTALKLLQLPRPCLWWKIQAASTIPRWPCCIRIWLWRIRGTKVPCQNRPFSSPKHTNLSPLGEQRWNWIGSLCGYLCFGAMFVCRASSRGWQGFKVTQCFSCRGFP